MAGIAGQPVIKAFADSISNFGHSVRLISGTETPFCDVAVIWSLLWTKRERKQIYLYYRERNIPLIVLEVGALKRNVLWKVGINGINRRAKWIEPFMDRVSALGITMLDWRQTGSHIVVCGQNQMSNEWPFSSMESYLLDQIHKLRCYTDRPIVVRPHPRYPVRLPNLGGSISVSVPKFVGGFDNYDFTQAVSGAWAVLSYNSNCGIESTLQGIPAFVGESSLVWELGNTDLSRIESPKLEDRFQWANRIAHTEFSIEEIRSGFVWERIEPLLAVGT